MKTDQSPRIWPIVVFVGITIALAFPLFADSNDSKDAKDAKETPGSKSGSDTATLSQHSIQVQLDDIYQQIKAVKADGKKLDDYQQKLLKSKASLAAASWAEPSKSAATSFVTVFEALKAVQPDQELRRTDSVVLDFLNGFDRLALMTAIDGGSFGDQSIISQLHLPGGAGGYPNFGPTEADPVILRVLYRLTDSGKVDQSLTLFDRMPKTGALWQSLSSYTDSGLKRERLAKQIADVDNEVKDVQKTSENLFKEVKSRAQTTISQLETALAAEIVANLKDRRDLEDRAVALDKQLSAGQTAQKTVSDVLIYAVIMMIAAIVVSFVALRLFSVDLAKAIVTERTLIELLSMGFLLLTIIFLGTGKFLESQSLGTILGTVAGYIFGRDTLRRAGQSIIAGTAVPKKSTHELTTAADYYATAPAEGVVPTPAGRFLAGTKVAIVSHGGTYAEVKTEDGKQGFVSDSEIRASD